MRITSGTTDQYIYFVAVDPEDLVTRETGLNTANFTVYRSRNGAAAAAMTTPTINETDSSNMPGVYELLLDEDTTIAAGNQSEEMALHITHASAAAVTRVIELYRPSVTEGETLTVSGGLGTVNTTQIEGSDATDQINAACDTALSDINLDHLAFTSAGDSEVANNSIIARLTSKSATASFASYDHTTDSLEAIRDRGDTDWITATGFSTHSAADVWTAGTRTLTASTNFNDLSSADVSAAVQGALTGINLDHIAFASAGDSEVANNSIVARLTSKSATASFSSYDHTTDSLEAVRDQGDSAWITAVGFSTHTAADVWTNGTRTLTAGDNLNDISSAEVSAAVQGALVGINLDHLIFASAGNSEVATNSVLAQIAAASAAADWSDFDNTTDSLQAIRDHVGDGTNLTEAGGTGDHLSAIPWNSAWSAEVSAATQDALTGINLDHLVFASAGNSEVATNSVIAQLAAASAAADWSDFDNTTDSLQAIADSGGGGPTAAQIADAVWDEAQADHTGAGTFGELAVESSAIAAETARLDGTKIPDTISLANINTQVDTALTDINLDHLIFASAGNSEVAVNSVLAQIAAVSGEWSDFVNTTDSLEAIADSGGGGPTAAQIADAVWDEAQADHVGAGTFGELAVETSAILADTVTLVGRVPDTISLANINTEVDTALTDINLDHIVFASAGDSEVANNSIVAKLTSKSATANFSSYDNTTDSLEAIRDHVGDGTNLTEAGGTGDHLTAIPWNAAWSADVSAATQGALTGINLDHLIAASAGNSEVVNNSVIARIVSASAAFADFDESTDSLQAIRDRGDAAWITAVGFSTLTSAGVSAVVNDNLNNFGVSTLTAAQVNTEVSDVIKTDTITLPGQEAPTATPTFEEAVSYLYKAFRNKITQTSAQYTLYADDGSTVDQKATVTDDGTTFTRGEIGSGP